jgi:hypothetical protein
VVYTGNHESGRFTRSCLGLASDIFAGEGDGDALCLYWGAKFITGFI